MKINVPFKNPKTGEVKFVKVGWSWTLFFFAGILGIPLFLRKLNAWGGIFLALWAINFLLPNIVRGPDGLVVYTALFLAFFGLTIWVSIKGNELTAKNYLDIGWVFAEPDSEATRFGKMNGGIMN